MQVRRKAVCLATRGTKHTSRGTFPVEVRAATAPDGSAMVLLQIPDGYLLMTGTGARLVAELLDAAADEVDSAGDFPGPLATSRTPDPHPPRRS